MPHSGIPVIRQPFAVGDPIPFWAIRPSTEPAHELYDVSIDPEEAENRAGQPEESTMVDMLRAALADLRAPEDQLVRLDLG